MYILAYERLTSSPLLPPTTHHLSHPPTTPIPYTYTYWGHLWVSQRVWGGGGRSRAQNYTCGKRAVPYSCSLYNVFHSVIFNSVFTLMETYIYTQVETTWLNNCLNATVYTVQYVGFHKTWNCITILYHFLYFDWIDKYKLSRWRNKDWYWYCYIFLSIVFTLSNLFKQEN